MRRKLHKNISKKRFSSSKFLRVGIYTSLFILAFFIGVKYIGNNSISEEQKPQKEKDDNLKLYDFKEMGFTFKVPKEYYVNFETLTDTDTGEPYAYTVTVQNYKYTPGKENNYKLYGIYRFNTQQIKESEHEKFKKTLKEGLKPEAITTGSFWGHPLVSGQLKDGDEELVTYILKNGYLMTITTTEPTNENDKKTEAFLKSIVGSESFCPPPEPID